MGIWMKNLAREEQTNETFEFGKPRKGSSGWDVMDGREIQSLAYTVYLLYEPNLKPPGGGAPAFGSKAKAPEASTFAGAVPASTSSSSGKYLSMML